MKRLAVLGYPVGHSRSPAMQNAALAFLGLDREWSYEAVAVEPARFVELVRGMEADGFVGANVTVPHKQAALELADEATPVAAAIGAANTLTLAGGRILAENTDAPGVIDALPGSPAGKRVLLLGAGGAARAVLWALLGAGAEVDVWNRTADRAEALVAELGGRAVSGTGIRGPEYDLIFNSSAAGLDGSDSFRELPLDPGCIAPGRIVVDMVYGERETSLITAARKAGAEVVDGLEILVRQGARSLEIWTGEKPPLEVMRAAARSV
ncbi:MAG: shikimate dehydrogenase [Solirubrobacterales bacterium]|nr:shikimate dehydrogenase [Solirubrobacterales bacterium]